MKDNYNKNEDERYFYSLSKYDNEGQTVSALAGPDFKLLTDFIPGVFLRRLGKYVVFTAPELINGKKVQMYGLYDTLGKVILAPQFEELGGTFYKSGFLVKRNNQNVFIDYAGKVIYNGRVHVWNDELMEIFEGSKRGLAATDGTILVKPVYDEIQREFLLDRTLIKVKRNNIFFYADLEENEYIKN